MGIKSLSEIQTDDILEGPFWNGKLKVIAVKEIDSEQFELQGTMQVSGQGTNIYLPLIINKKDLEKINKINSNIDFSSDSNHLFLVIEANRLKYAYQLIHSMRWDLPR